jgi:hypothetical protein
MWKNLVHTLSNSDTIARWSSITFFFDTPCTGYEIPIWIRTISLYNCGPSWWY